MPEKVKQNAIDKFLIFNLHVVFHMNHTLRFRAGIGCQRKTPCASTRRVLNERPAAHLVPTPLQLVQDELPVRRHADEASPKTQDGLARLDHPRGVCLARLVDLGAEEDGELVGELPRRAREHTLREGIFVLEGGREDERREGGQAFLAHDMRVRRCAVLGVGGRDGERVGPVDDGEELEGIVDAEMGEDAIAEYALGRGDAFFWAKDARAIGFPKDGAKGLAADVVSPSFVTQDPSPATDTAELLEPTIRRLLEGDDDTTCAGYAADGGGDIRVKLQRRGEEVSVVGDDGRGAEEGGEWGNESGDCGGAVDA